jgi:hypothetical protein
VNRNFFSNLIGGGAQNVPSRIDNCIVKSRAFVGCPGSPFADAQITSLNVSQICKKKQGKIVDWTLL